MQYDAAGREYVADRLYTPIDLRNFAATSTPYLAAELANGKVTHQRLRHMENEQILARRAQGVLSREVLTASHANGNPNANFYPYRHIY